MIIGLLAMATAAASRASDLKFREEVAALGGSQSYKHVEAIAGSGCDALPVLVRELRVFRPGRYSPEQQGFTVNHTIYAFAALRRITGRDFYGHLNQRQLAKTSEEERYFIRQFVPSGKAKPFGIWLSRGTVYFAPLATRHSPLATQRESIRAWRRYAASRSCTVPPIPSGNGGSRPNTSRCSDGNVECSAAPHGAFVGAMFLMILWTVPSQRQNGALRSTCIAIGQRRK